MWNTQSKPTACQAAPKEATSEQRAGAQHPGPSLAGGAPGAAGNVAGSKPCKTNKLTKQPNPQSKKEKENKTKQKTKDEF